MLATFVCQSACAILDYKKQSQYVGFFVPRTITTMAQSLENRKIFIISNALKWFTPEVMTAISCAIIGACITILQKDADSKKQQELDLNIKKS